MLVSERFRWPVRCCRRMTLADIKRFLLDNFLPVGLLIAIVFGALVPGMMHCHRSALSSISLHLPARFGSSSVATRLFHCPIVDRPTQRPGRHCRSCRWSTSLWRSFSCSPASGSKQTKSSRHSVGDQPAQTGQVISITLVTSVA